MNYDVFWVKNQTSARLIKHSVLDLAVSLEFLRPKIARRLYVRAQRLGKDVVDVALAEGYLSEDDVAALQSIAFDCEEVDLSVEPPQGDLKHLLPMDEAVHHRIIPWQSHEGRITYVTDRPDYFRRELQIKTYFRNHGEIVVTTRSQWQQALNRFYGVSLAQEAEISVPYEQSCRGLFSAAPMPKIRMVGMGCFLLALLLSFPIGVLGFFLVLSLAALMAMQCLKLCAFFTATLGAAKRPWTRRVNKEGYKNPAFSILVPLYQETEIAQTLIKRLMKLKYSRSLLEIILVLEYEDQQTADVLENTDLPSHFKVIRVPPGNVTTKPRAMNYCLPFCKGDIVGIFDAEDSPDPKMIAKVAQHFTHAPRDVACVQARLGFYNSHSNFLARCFTIEYATWFRHILPGLAALDLVVPLGGTSVFIKAEVLRNLGAWDAFNVTEDADLGIRLARAGYRTDVIDITTTEEANARLWPWIKQRSRWLKGYIVTYMVHMARPRALLRDVGWRKFIGINVLFGGAILQITTAPLIWSLWLVLMPIVHPIEAAWPPMMLSLLIVILGFSTLVDVMLWLWVVFRLRRLMLLTAVPVMFIYLSFATIAIAKAWWEIFTRPFYWDKTMHGHSLEETGLSARHV